MGVRGSFTQETETIPLLSTCQGKLVNKDVITIHKKLFMDRQNIKVIVSGMHLKLYNYFQVICTQCLGYCIISHEN